MNAAANTLTDQQIIAAITKSDTPGAERFLGMGFRLHRVALERDDGRFGGLIVVRAEFTCVCGRLEYWRQILSDHAPLDYQNIYNSIVRFGATSRGHLLEDGYTEEEIADMERRLDENNSAGGRVGAGAARRVYRENIAATVPRLAQDAGVRHLPARRDGLQPDRPQPLQRIQRDRDKGA